MNGLRLTNEEALNHINERCKEKNYEFLGFNNEENRYINHKTLLKLHCNCCGNTWNTTTYNKFISANRGCPYCNGTNKTIEQIEKDIKNRCQELDYTFIDYVEKDKKITSDTHIILKCNKCGKEWNTTTIVNFLRRDRKSHKCGKHNPGYMPVILKDEKKVIEDINNKLQGSNLIFEGFVEGSYIGYSKTHILLKCNICGEVMDYELRTIMLGNNVVRCKRCEVLNKVSNEDAIRNIEEKCKLIGYTFLGFNNPENRYDGKDTYLILQCNECGYIWKSTKYQNFMREGVIKCKGCQNAWKLECEVRLFLKEENINFEEQKRFDWLKNKSKLSIDFYLPDYRLCIECQGRQHFVPVDKFGGVDGFEGTKNRDITKYNLCSENGYKILYYGGKSCRFNEFLNNKIIRQKSELIKEIYGRD